MKYYEEISIVDYLLSINEPIEKCGGNYYQHSEHDSLKINVRKNYFVWNSRIGEKNAKGGILQYLQIVHGLSFEQAKNQLENYKGDKNIQISKIDNHYPKVFNYKVKEKAIPLDMQKYLVFNRKIPNTIVKYFHNLDLISQNENKEIIFKWYKDNKVVGFTKQGTVRLSDEQKEKYHTKRDYIKYVAPTTEEYTYWGFNYSNSEEPESYYFFESPIDLISYYALNYDELNQLKFWLISIDGLSKDKLFCFLDYGLKNLNLKNRLKQLNICFDNDEAGIKAYKDLEKIMINNIKFTRVEVSLGYKDWNEYLQAKRG